MSLHCDTCGCEAPPEVVVASEAACARLGAGISEPITTPSGGIIDSKIAGVVWTCVECLAKEHASRAAPSDETGGVFASPTKLDLPPNPNARRVRLPVGIPGDELAKTVASAMLDTVHAIADGVRQWKPTGTTWPEIRDELAGAINWLHVVEVTEAQKSTGLVIGRFLLLEQKDEPRPAPARPPSPTCPRCRATIPDGVHEPAECTAYLEAKARAN